MEWWDWHGFKVMSAGPEVVYDFLFPKWEVKRFEPAA
jgi:hypothetical protein